MQKTSSVKALGVVAALLIVAGATIAYAAFSLSVTAPFTATSAPPAPLIAGATVDANACTVASNGLSASCAGTTGAIGASYTLTVTVQNTGSASVPVTVTATSDNTGAFTITAFGSNPTSIAASGSASFSFTVTAMSAGISNITVGISG